VHWISVIKQGVDKRGWNSKNGRMSSLVDRKGIVQCGNGTHGLMADVHYKDRSQHF
jgi:hypothetical protein